MPRLLMIQSQEIMNKRPKSWYYSVVDHDQKIFSVSGPVSTEQALNETVIAAQESGRDIRSDSCWTVDDKQRSTNHWKSLGYKEVEDALVDKPNDRSSEYIGALPNYAKNADRAKIVKILCGRCNTTRFAEMTVDYPGRVILHLGDLGTYEARCLKCKGRTSDPYNWYR